MNKKGMTLGLWTEVALFSIAFVLILGFVVAEFNTSYGTNNDPSFGLSSNVNETQQSYKDLQTTIQGGVNDGEVSNTAAGFSVSSSWGILKSMGGIVWDIIAGGWIEKSIALMELGYAGTVLGITLRILYVISIGIIILTIIFKVRP